MGIFIHLKLHLYILWDFFFQIGHRYGGCGGYWFGQTLYDKRGKERNNWCIPTDNQ